MRAQIFNNVQASEEVFRYVIDGHFNAVVEMNSDVSPEVILLRGQGRQQEAKYDVGKLLGIKESQVAGAIQIDDGVFVNKGDILAMAKGTRILAPHDGMVGVELPYISMYTPYSETVLKSGVWGRVVYADSQGVSVKATTINIQGVTGAGPTALGILHKIAKKDQPIDITKTEDDLMEKIVYVPFNITANGFKHLVGKGVTGIVAPAIRWDDYRALYEYYQNRWPVTFVITQGWGSMSTYHYIWKMLTWGQGKRVKLLGQEHQLALSWNPQIHRSLFEGFGIHLLKHTPRTYFADLHTRDRIRLFDGREAAVVELVDSDYLTVQVMGTKQVVSRQEILKLHPLI